MTSDRYVLTATTTKLHGAGGPHQPFIWAVALASVDAVAAAYREQVLLLGQTATAVPLHERTTAGQP
jgi:hypothetical protein